MGNFGGGASTGGGGGTGPAGMKTDGTYGTKRDAVKASNRNKVRKAAKEIVDYVKGGGAVGKLVRDFTKSQKQKNRTTKGGDVFSGEAYGYNEAEEKRDFKGTRNLQPNNDRDPQYQSQGIEVAKASTPTNEVSKTQADAVAEAPKGPTSIEMAQAEEDAEAKRLLKIKREGRKSTILNIPEEELTLSKKVLLG